ncbi:hypothetical protein EV356DRAFT_452798 [Viridothelium virens]|uniref:Uncharacterized protein n=1 Tax=Viridothelium virens TaxID=1048519 RepID=A0A6A6GYZ0_VIRVR|nr:hypothetical protein EV356DRAFT_452798 [Viridothelium virens]
MDNLEKRQGITAPSSTSSSTGTTPTVSTMPASGNAADFNITQWNEMTAQACSSAIQALNGNAGNPSGMAVCYNVPFLDNSTGVFESEVRLFNLSAPSGEWAGLSMDAISISMSYLGASVAPTRGLMMAKRDVSTMERRQSIMSAMTNKTYIGQIHNSITVNGMTVPQLQSLLIPNITLHALSPQTAQPISTNLSSTDASFVSGVFSQQSTATTDPNAVASASASAMAQKAFVLPGTTFRIPLIGFAITLAWTGLFVLAVGLGTVGRVHYRDQYRKNVKTASVKNVSRI